MATVESFSSSDIGGTVWEREKVGNWEGAYQNSITEGPGFRISKDIKE